MLPIKLKILSEVFVKYMLNISRQKKRGIVVTLDVSSCFFSVWLSFYLRLGDFVPLSNIFVWPAIISVSLLLPISIKCGLYRAIYRYSGLPAMMALGRAILIYGVVFSAIFTFWGVKNVPRTIGIIQPIVLFIFLGVSRTWARVWFGDLYNQQIRKVSLPKALIYGAGKAGRQLAIAMANNSEIQIVGFLDDNPNLHGQMLNGLLINDPADLGEILFEFPVAQVLLAIPSASVSRRHEILNFLKSYKVVVKTLPKLSDLAVGKVLWSEVRELDIDDLLGRESVSPQQDLLKKNILGKTVLVTGAGGSIGSELCRQIVGLGVDKLLLVDCSEFALYSIYHELEEKSLGKLVILVPLLASSQDKRRMEHIISTWLPNTVYHAAAYKHVPLVEHNFSEGIKNNVFGTLHIAQLASSYEVDDFVLISTDKAVRPTNLMGASKRLSEMVLQGLATKSQVTKFTIVRFGNVLGSSGSVVPKFRRQICDGGPITLTHPEIIRYFMTIPEAAQLVIQSGAMSTGGEVFVLDMGEPIRIMDLAYRMVELSGLTIRDELNPHGDVEIKITGLRPGEKLFEELLIGDNPEFTSHPQIMRARETFMPWNDLELQLQVLLKLLEENDLRHIQRLMIELVHGYKPNEEISDWVFMEKRLKAACLEGS